MALIEFKFTDNVQPSGRNERLPPGVYKAVIKGVKDVTRKNKDGEEYLQAEFKLSIDPSEGVKGSTRMTLSYPNPEDPEGGTAGAWLAVWMWVLKKDAKTTRNYLNTKKMDWAEKLGASNGTIGINVYETTYNDKQTGEAKKGLRVWPLSMDDYNEAKADAAGDTKVKSKGKGKSAVSDDEDEDEDLAPAKGKGKAAADEEDDDFDI